MKSQSDIWKGPHSPRAQKVRCQCSKMKDLMTFAYDKNGVITTNRFLTSTCHWDILQKLSIKYLALKNPQTVPRDDEKWFSIIS